MKQAPAGEQPTSLLLVRPEHISAASVPAHKAGGITNRFLIPALLLFLISCSPGELTTPLPTSTQAIDTAAIPATQTTEASPMPQTQFADVLSVRVTGNPGAYQFAVKISSPDTGCDQFADWWEVVSVDGRLLYRRILLHSHVDENPFLRSGGPVEISPDEVVFVRAHLNPIGYGGQVMKGTVQAGFESVEAEAGFGSALERVPPQPEDCAF
jgi:hypothetical protein